MRLRRVVTSAAIVASLGALTAVTVPAIAGTNQNSPETTTSALDAPILGTDIAPEMRVALRRDLNLSDEQVDLILHKEAWASQTVTALRSGLQDSYAGAWLNEGAEQLTVAVTTEAAAQKVRAAGAEPELVTRSQADLDRIKAALDAHADHATATITGWHVDVSTNEVVLLAAPGAEDSAQDFARLSGVADAVRVQTAERPRLLQQNNGSTDIRGGDEYAAADSVGRFRCSVGFAVVGGFVTAGHCVGSERDTFGADGLPQGRFTAASFPGIGLGGPDDWALVEVNDDWTPRPVVNSYSGGGELPVAGSDEAPIGASVCKYGATSGVSCGVIEAKDVTTFVGDSAESAVRVTGLTRASFCADFGDSGGAVISGDQAQGMISAGPGDCTVPPGSPPPPPFNLFQPLNPVLDLLANDNITLLTTDAGGQAPPQDEREQEAPPQDEQEQEAPPQEQEQEAPPQDEQEQEAPPQEQEQEAPPQDEQEQEAPPQDEREQEAPPQEQEQEAPPEEEQETESGQFGTPSALNACTTSERTFRGQLTRAGTTQVQPNGRFYRALSAGTHTVCLAAPRQATFDLDVQRWNGEAFETVARTTGTNTSEALTFNGDAGFYRVMVTAQSGQGGYVVGLDVNNR